MARFESVLINLFKGWYLSFKIQVQSVLVVIFSALYCNKKGFAWPVFEFSWNMIESNSLFH